MSWSWWPENSEGQEHEAWIQPIFHDGEEGTGTTNHAGVVFDCYGPNERVRPFAEISHLRMVCTCGWTGITVALADMQGHLVDWKHHEPTEAGEARFLDEWQQHLAPLKAADAETCPTCGGRGARRSDHALHQRDMWARLVADALVDGDTAQLADYVERYAAARRVAGALVEGLTGQGGCATLPGTRLGNGG